MTSYTRATVAMDTVVTASAESDRPSEEIEAALERALGWFAAVEQICSRFDPESELMRLCRQPGVAVPVSALLFEAVSFALQVARLTRGAFDPTIGGQQQRRGLTRNYVSGEEITSAAEQATWRDLRLNRRRRTILLQRPLLLDLGAVAKGLAIDLAARELGSVERFAIEAGGDLFAGGAAQDGEPWRIGVQHPLREGLLGSVAVWNRAVCTSGGYERPVDSEGEHHLLDPRTGRSPHDLVSLTAVAPTALVADALGTAAFVLGERAGLRLLQRQGIAGIAVTAQHRIRLTPEAGGDLQWQLHAE
jgi:thiamine biosynthesis lipoprotein